MFTISEKFTFAYSDVQIIELKVKNIPSSNNALANTPIIGKMLSLYIWSYKSLLLLLWSLEIVISSKLLVIS